MARRGLSFISALRRIAPARLLPPLEPGAWGWIVVPSALSLAILLGSGPWLQLIFVGLLSSDAPTIYGTAWSESLIDFPTLGDWLLYGGHWPLLIVSAVAVVAGLYARRFAGMCALIGFASFMALCFFDITFNMLGVYQGVANAPSIFTIVAANLAGSCLLALLMGGLFWLYEKVRDLMPSALAPAGGALTILLASVGLSSICYFALAYFYRPLPIEMEATAKTPIKGNYSPLARDASSGGLGTEKFDPKPNLTLGGKADLTIPGESLKIDWRGPTKGAVFDVNIDFFSGCWAPKDIRALKGDASAIRRRNVRRIKLTIDKGLNELYVAADPLNLLSVEAKEPLFFAVKDEKLGTEFRYFPGSDAAFLNRTSGAQMFFASTSFAPMGKPSKRRIPRAMSLDIDGERIDMTWDVQGPSNLRRGFDCRALRLPENAAKTDARLHSRLPGDTLFVGARVAIEPREPAADDFLSHDDNILRVPGNIGWATIDAIERESLAEKEAGTAEMLMLSEGLVALTLDGRKIGVRHDDKLVVLGKISGEYGKDSNLVLSGQARNLWLNDKRLNPTKWERLALEVQLFVITTLLAAGLGIARSLRPIARRFANPAPLAGLRAEAT